MLSFKQFLEASAPGSKEPEWSPIQEEEAMEILKSKCSEAMWMVEMDNPLFRGEHYQAIAKMSKTGFAKVDPSLSKRVSQNTTNHYTVLLDNLPAYKHFPKRQHSFVCTMSSSVAKLYGDKDFSQHDRLMTLIPYNGTEIGVVNSMDIWDVKLKCNELFGKHEYSMISLNDLFISMDVQDTWEGIKAFDKKLKDEYDEELIEHFYEVFKYATRGAHKKFLELIAKLLSPEKTKFETATPASLKKYYGDRNEIWVSGPCLAISFGLWDRIVRDYRSKAKKK